VTRLLLILFTLVISATLSRAASAQEYTRRSYILPEGSVELTGDPARPMMASLDLSEDKQWDPIFEPFHLPIHVYFGVSENLTLGITHDFGPCFNCDRAYNDVGLGLLYSLVRNRDFELDLHLTAPLFQRFHPDVHLSVRGGVLGRVNLGEVVALVFDPSLKIGFTGRSDRRGANREYLYLPAWFYFQATETIVPFVGTALHGPVEGFFDHIQIPLEGGMVFSVTRNVDLGFVLRFSNLLGEGGSADWRELGFVGRFRF
jgi:hypothetical protein